MPTAAGTLPVLVEARIDAVLAFGRLDEGEGNAGVRVTVCQSISPCHLEMSMPWIGCFCRVLCAEVLRIGVLEACFGFTDAVSR